jgi:hypothetical protein
VISFKNGGYENKNIRLNLKRVDVSRLKTLKLVLVVFNSIREEKSLIKTQLIFSDSNFLIKDSFKKISFIFDLADIIRSFIRVIIEKNYNSEI